MKNKTGFTLIELLAVIVVLAIIALIATPIVMNTIKNAKKGAAERTADNYTKALEQKVAESRIDGTKIPDGIYNIQPDGNLCPASGCGENDKDKSTIDMDGSKPTKGIVVISNGRVSQSETIMTVSDYNVKYNDNKCKVVTVVYRWSEDRIKIGDTIDLSDASKFAKDASTLGKNYYLKHILDKDNKVIESYACAILKDKEYCLKGGRDNNGNSFYGYAENEADYTGNMLILKWLRDIGLECNLSGDVYRCNENSVGLSINSLYDLVFSRGNNGGCFITLDGYSACGD